MEAPDLMLSRFAQEHIKIIQYAEIKTHVFLKFVDKVTDQPERSQTQLQ